MGADAVQSCVHARAFHRIDQEHHVAATACAGDLAAVCPYSVERQPLGTGGAIRAAARLASCDHVYAVNGDTYASVDYAAMLAQHRSLQDVLSVALMHVADTARYGAAEVVQSRIESFTEKGRSGPGYINAGIYLLRRDILEDGLPECFSFEQDVLRPRRQQLRPAAFFASGYFIDIGIPEDYARAQHELPKQVELAV